MLDHQNFIKMIEAPPLVSVDIVLVRGGHEVLLGLRNNRPAQDFWFVPGGRILKNESIPAALLRIVENELGLARFILNGQLKAVFHGVYMSIGTKIALRAILAFQPITWCWRTKLR